MRHIGIKNTFRLLLAGLVVAAGASSAQAASVVGSAALNADSTVTTPPGNILTATAFSFTNITTSGANPFGTPGIPVGTSVNPGTTTLTVATPGTFAFGNGTFGQFIATAILSDTSANDGGDFTRNIRLSGFFTGGTLFPGKNDITPVRLTLGLTQTGGAGNAISSSFTIFAAAVPEPASVAMLGLGLVGALGATRLRRKTV